MESENAVVWIHSERSHQSRVPTVGNNRIDVIAFVFCDDFQKGRQQQRLHKHSDNINREQAESQGLGGIIVSRKVEGEMTMCVWIYTREFDVVFTAEHMTIFRDTE